MLSDAKIRTLRPKEKAYKVYDDRGLYMVVNPNGSRWWRFKYKYDGKERGISLGVYPDVTLAYAREQLQEARQLLARGIDPSAQRRTVKIARADTFKVIAEEWLEMQAERLAPITMTKARWILRSFIYPRLGSRPIAAISAPEVLTVLRPIESRGMNETAHRALQRCGQIFRYAIATGRATRDITSDLRGALAPVVVENRAAITEPAKIGALLRAIDDYIGHPTTLIALKLSPLVFLRPSELRAAEWSEIDLQAAEWRVPAARMKMRERHIVPLASQAVALLRELRSVTGEGRYLFPSLRTADRPMSVNTVNAALRRLGYASDEMTGHGFRAMAYTCLNELGWHPDVIELQMAHAERNKVRAAYNRAERLAERGKMMQAWADYLDGLRAGRRESRFMDEAVQRAQGVTQSGNQAQSPSNCRKQAKKGATTVSQLELFCVPGGE